MRKQYILFFIAWLGVLSGTTAQIYPSMEQFGKNRIQYRQFDWKLVKTANFEIYFYQDGNQLANLAAQYAESEFDRITELLGYTPYNRIKVFLFNSPQELAQSNIGLSTHGDLNGREIDLAKSRLEIAFTGDQISFRRQLVHDITMLFVYDMLYGGSLKDALQSSLLLTLPDWFMPGIAAYAAEGWSTDLDDYMRDVALNHPVRKPSLLMGKEAERIGHSIWNYIAQKYGRDNISNILNLTRIIRNEQSSIASTLGVPYNRFLRDWREYYAGMAKTVTQSYQQGQDDFRIKIGSAGAPFQLNNLKLSPDKQFIAYTTVRDGKFNVEVVNTTTRKRLSVLNGGYRQDEQNLRPTTPLVAWQRGNNLVVVSNEKGKSYLYTFTDVDKRPKIKDRRVIQGLTQVVSMDASEDGSSLIMSADRKGQNDLYLYSIGRGTYQQLTNDLYDDMNPAFAGRTTTPIVFSSNRLQDTLGVDKGSYKTIRDRMSLFLHEGGARAASVTRLTDSLRHAVQPLAAGENTIYYLSDAAGIRNLYRLDTTTRQVRQLTAFPYGIHLYNLNPANGGFVYSTIQNGDIYISYRSKLDLNQSVQTTPTQRNISLGFTPSAETTPAQRAVSPTDTTTRPVTQVSQATPSGRSDLEPGEVNTDNYQFDEDVLKAAEYRQRRTLPSSPTSIAPPRNRRRENITIRGPFDYQGLFIANDASSAWRVDPIRGFGYTQTITMNDLLENHIIKAGLFITTNLRNSDLFAEYNNLTHRVDYGARVDRQTLFLDNGGLSQKYRYNRVAASASYPLSVTSRFTISPSYTVTRLLDLSFIGQPDRTSEYGGLRGEFVYDNTKVNGMNMLEGTRFKARYDEYVGVRNINESFNRFMFDLRHYQKLHRDLMLAVRVSYGQSGGAAPKQSTLGGMENWIARQFEPSARNPVQVPNPLQDTRDDYRDVFFLDFAAPLRGFRLGKLTGNSHLLLNTEFRIPLVRYLYRGTITSNFLRNLQLVAFSDIGTAWTGKGPFSRQNSLNTEVVGGGNLPFRATVTNFKNPFLIGYGAGIRTMLFGYYVKFDYAWGLENNVVSKAIPYLTLGYDF
ncbi:basic secretory protein-like protein [Nibrella saemangeumensis]|uniref:Basic secretory protein-like protein n=1 Tax=Nibrella saemangeumensis TaxID=1084526 RepID=A0ABP8MMG8_9BACT